MPSKRDDPEAVIRKARQPILGTAPREVILPPEASSPATSEPALSAPSTAELFIHKKLMNKKSFTSEPPKQRVRTKLKQQPSKPPLIIGFDAEWITQPPEPSDEDEDGDGSENAGGGERFSTGQIQHNRILSYQYACCYRDRKWSGIVYTRAGERLRHPENSDAKKIPERLSFGRLLAEAVMHGIREKLLTRWPKKVIAAAHWTRADLSAMADFPLIKHEFNVVQNTYVTLGKGYTAHVNIAGHPREFRVSLADTQLLAPGSSGSLAALGDLYEFLKLDPGDKQVVQADGSADEAPYIEHMDWLLVDDPLLYESYAIRDAEISARHVDGLLHFVNNELGLSYLLPPPTLGSLAMRHLVESWKRDGVNPDALLDGKIDTIKRYNAGRRRFDTTRKRIHTPKFRINQQLVTYCFHGGRNECFSFGPTSDAEGEGAPPFREYDLIGAYAVALASIGTPDWLQMYDCNEPRAYSVGVFGFAYVHFRFPDETRFPSLPVVAPHDYGLIYPLEGETYATASEIAVARRQGADIDIIKGVIIPWRDGGHQPFMKVLADLHFRRQKHPKDTLPNAMFKQLGNSIYGKLGQGAAGTKVYDVQTNGQQEIGVSEIANVYLAAHVCGLIRALIGELLISIPPHRTVVSVTTDACITNADLGEVDQAGPVASYLSGVKQQLTGHAVLLETKFEARQLLPWRTRGVATIGRQRNSKTKLARGGMREERKMSLANDWFTRSMLFRQPGDAYSILEPLPFPKAHRSNADHVFERHKRLKNFEYDFKRRPLDPTPCFVTVPGVETVIVQHIAFETAPWRTVGEFVEARECFDGWRRKQAGQLKTMVDWHRWVAYRDGTDASRAGVRRSAGGPVDQARRLVIRAYRHRQWGLPGGGYRTAVERLSAAGYCTSIQDFKNAARVLSTLPECTIPADADGVQDFVRTVCEIWPEFAWWRLVREVDTDHLRQILKSRSPNAA